MKIRDSENGFPKVRKLEEYGGSPLIGQLSTITEKESEENLLHNYLRKNVSQKRRSKTNMGKVIEILSRTVSSLAYPPSKIWSSK
jgi:hypothetical protein